MSCDATKRLAGRIEALLALKDFVRVAIDGRCGSGKTTLAEQLAARFGANLLHMDDYYVPFAEKTPERLAIPGGNVDHERFLEEVLSHSVDEDVIFRRFDCRLQQLREPTRLHARPLTIVEGSYSLHPALRDFYDLKVFLTVDPEVQSQRILARNGSEGHRRFIEEWIPLEEAYFSACNVSSICDITLDTSDWF